VVIRPGDANEVVEAWRVAINRRDGPTALLLSRQSTPTIDRQIFSPAAGVSRGAYILADMGAEDPDIVLMASGTEVDLIVKAGLKLAAEGINTRLVSFPSWELFEAQDQAYRDRVLSPKYPRRLAIEAGVAQGWARWVGDQGSIISVETFGASAPVGVLYEQYGLTVDRLIDRTKEMLGA
jgi:transketolase